MKYLVFPRSYIQLVDENTGDVCLLDDLVERGVIHAKEAKRLRKKLKQESEICFQEVAIKNYEKPEELFNEDSTYAVYKLRAFIESSRKGKFLDILALILFKFQFHPTDHFFLKDVPNFPIIGCSELHGDKWYTFRKKSGVLEALPRKALMKLLKKDGYLAILPHLAVPFPTIEVRPVNQDGSEKSSRYRVIC